MSMQDKDLSRLRIDRGAARRGGKSGWLAFAVLLAAALSYAGWQALAASRGRAPRIEVARVLRVGGAEAQSGVSANGYVIARRRAALSTDMQGRIVALPVEEGQSVRKGDLIARLDTSQLEASAARTRADLASARSALELSRLDHPRIARLVHEKVAPVADLDAARSSLARAEAAVRSLEAALEEVDVMIAKSAVHAPFDGVVVQKNAEVGEVVSTFGSGGPSSRGAVATLVDFDSLEVQVELAQTSLRSARVGAPVLVFLDAFSEEPLAGRVRQIWPTADRQKATVELRVGFEKRDPRVLPEMGVRVVFVAGEGTEPRPVEVLVPRRAVVAGTESAVFVFRDGRAVRRAIDLGGAEKDGRLPVRKGLQGGELVVLDPPASLADGDAVELKKEEAK